ncbi:MAG TPA: hypothetical protein VGZ02_17165 [Candidatus Baltobacteraceae bacterium]|jgi:uncharacterized membrane protein|nr:hypothetical protein [Candidatus Baltobacteraceae bacterium]
MATQIPPQDTPFGLQANVAAGLAYLFGLIGGLVMLFGGGTNRFVKWAAAQSITIWGIWIALWIVLDIATSLVHILGLLTLVLFPILGLVFFVIWIWTFITAFQGKEVEVPIIAGITRNIFRNIDTMGVGTPPAASPPPSV